MKRDGFMFWICANNILLVTEVYYCTIISTLMGVLIINNKYGQLKFNKVCLYVQISNFSNSLRIFAFDI